jgi:hypothetical protein
MLAFRSRGAFVEKLSDQPILPCQGSQRVGRRVWGGAAIAAELSEANDACTDVNGGELDRLAGCHCPLPRAVKGCR